MLKILEKLAKQKFNCIPLEIFYNLKNIGLDEVVFDMQAAKVEEYNELMGTKNNFVSLLDSIKNVSKSGLETSIHFVPNKININHFKDILELADLAQIDEVRVLRFVSQGRGKVNKDKLQLNEKKLKEFIEECEKITNSKVKIGIPLQNDNNHLCTVGFYKLVIRYDGQVLPCPAFKDIDLNLLEVNNFKSVNIYNNLSDFKFVNETRKHPLCK